MKQTVTVSLTASAPVVTTALTFADSVYSKLVGVRMIGENDNATTAVQVQAVVSRSAAPITTGAIATEKALARGDALIATFDVDAGKARIMSSVAAPDAVVDQAQLFDAAGGGYLGLKAVGLESGKTALMQVEVEWVEVAKSVATTGVYLAQVVNFQAVGT